MASRHWVAVEWNAAICKYTARTKLSGVPPLVQRQRIPSINRLLETPPDPDPSAFRQELDEDIDAAIRRLTRKADGLDVNTLQEYAGALARRTGIGGLPSNVLNILTASGVLHEISSQIAPEISDSQREFEALGPLEVLALPPERASPEMKQLLLSRHAHFSADLKSLQQRWSSQLENAAQAAPSPAGGALELLQRLLPVQRQSRVVATELALITSQMASAKFPQSLSRLCRILGNSLEDALLAELAATEQQPLYHRRSKYLWGLVSHNGWSAKCRLEVGAYWLQLALRNCRFDMDYKGGKVSRPAFWKTWYMPGASKCGIMLVNDALLRQLKASVSSAQDTKTAAARLVTSAQVPQLVAPRPWTSLHATNVPVSAQGLNLITSLSNEGQSTVLEALKLGTMQPQLNALNRLQSQAWRINDDVLRILKQSAAAEFTSSNDTSSSSRKISEAQWSQALAIAEALLGQDFYLPMYMDFRGRCYAGTRSILNYMGRDSIRALFAFGGKPKPLGQEGLGWLEVHLANMFGSCKAQSYTERRDWVLRNRRNILESAAHPEETSAWWRQAKKPYQTLAACFELARVWQSPEPAAALSRLPVQLDGSSNGLQHLVALSRDDSTATDVNLTGSECSDVYSSVGAGLGVGREAVKQCMISFFYGASAARVNQGMSDGRELAPLLEDRFSRPHSVQRWLVDCAQRLAHARRADHSFPGAAVAWTAKLGLPVVQTYAKPSLMAVRTPLQAFYLPSDFHLAEIDRGKQIAGVAANFVHSLDATHMLATAANLSPDVSFAAVHDSFWTHASTVPDMMRVLREQFVAVHEGDVLGELRNEWVYRYAGYVVPCTVYCDSPVYDKLVWYRSGVSNGRRLQACLDKELSEWYGRTPDWHSRLGPYNVQWQNAQAHIGTPGQASTKMWVPLEFAPPPEPGTLDINSVRLAQYLFN